MRQPPPGSTLDGNVRFVWTTGQDVTRYRLQIGSAPGGADLYDHTQEQTWALVIGLPRDGRKLYVRLQSFTQGHWFYNDYTYRAGAGRGWPPR
jgi:hypothetical protein